MSSTYESFSQRFSSSSPPGTPSSSQPTSPVSTKSKTVSPPSPSYNFSSSNFSSYTTSSSLYEEVKESIDSTYSNSLQHQIFSHNNLNTNKVLLTTANINTLSLDFNNNLKNVLESLYLAKKLGAKYRLGPELELSGYSCEDHFLELDTYLHIEESLAIILSSDISENFLCDIGCPMLFNNCRYNCRVFILNHQIVLIRPKIALANDGNYFEKRFFTNWKFQDTPTSSSNDPHNTTNKLEKYYLSEKLKHATKHHQQIFAPFGFAYLQLKNCKLASEICEELWLNKPIHKYLFNSGVEIITNGSGSHFEEFKTQKRYELIKNATNISGGCYLFSNIKGNDGNRLLFDGNSLISFNGKIIHKSSQFSLKNVEVIGSLVNLNEIVNHRLKSNSLQNEISSSNNTLIPSINLSDFSLACDLPIIYLNRNEFYYFNKVDGNNDRNSIQNLLESSSNLYEDKQKLNEKNIKKNEVDYFKSQNLPSKAFFLSNYIKLFNQYYYKKEEELVYGPSLWLFEYLMKSKASGYLLPLSGGADSASTVCILRIMAVKASNEFIYGGLNNLKGLVLIKKDGEDKKKNHLFFTDKNFNFSVYGTNSFFYDNLKELMTKFGLLTEYEYIFSLTKQYKNEIAEVLNSSTSTSTMEKWLNFSSYNKYEEFFYFLYKYFSTEESFQLYLSSPGLLAKFLLVEKDSTQHDRHSFNFNATCSNYVYYTKDHSVDFSALDTDKLFKLHQIYMNLAKLSQLVSNLLSYNIIHTIYLGTKNSTSLTSSRAYRLSQEINSYHHAIPIDMLVNSLLNIYVTYVNKGISPRFLSEGGSMSEDLALQNIQSRSRMVLSYLCAQLFPWTRTLFTEKRQQIKDGESNSFLSTIQTGKNYESTARGFLLVLASGNLDESLRGYLTKYDCSSGDLNPIGSMNKQDLKQMMTWAAKEYDLKTLAEISSAPPTAELRPNSTTDDEAESSQNDEEDMGMSYNDLNLYGVLRKKNLYGPVSMFIHLLTVWSHLAVKEIATKVKKFFTFYSFNRHKVLTLTPSFHYSSSSCDDNRYDFRPFLYNSKWERQFNSIDKIVEELEQQKE